MTVGTHSWIAKSLFAPNSNLNMQASILPDRMEPCGCRKIQMKKLVKPYGKTSKNKLKRKTIHSII